MLRRLEDKCQLYTESGQITEEHVDSRIDFHFNAMLDNVATWREDRLLNQDISLLGRSSYGKFRKLHVLNIFGSLHVCTVHCKTKVLECIFYHTLIL